ncbi:sensor histidine kinase [Salirhabdus sp. Marseille-P4669]|uniref:sensor histidine kinase n=1 Tax=Salirhabdus sp. Marseille-P4669 TaxID=2042310 RepID=UPI000C7C1E0D|nr:sensor histidine kinase [Salirhabdus sp. Marseille-P4669]
MKSYWLWLVLHVIVWPFAIVYIDLNKTVLPAPILGVTFYFLSFFIVPLIEKWERLLALLACVNVVVAVAVLFPYNGAFNPFLILILSLLIAEGFYRLTLPYSFLIAGVSIFGLTGSILSSNLKPLLIICCILYMCFLLIAMHFYKKTKDQLTDLDARYQAMYMEYRELKRRAVSEEELARQEERVLIAHEIHDSVGHRLTALIMQLEMFRLQATDDYKERVQSLKNLAQESLQETRRAVKSLKSNDPGGVPGIIRLIRRLELENLIRIHFTVKHGAFTTLLTGEQSFVIYRSVQEALTNIMKHSDSKEAEIMFEAPGGSIFRFEISNSVASDQTYKEGFGLSSMRERLEQHNGGLKVYQSEGKFLISGYLKITNVGDEVDSNTASGRPSDGAPRLKDDD